MRYCLSLVMLWCCCARWVEGAERKPAPSNRLSQVAPDGFPLFFPQERPAGPAAQPARSSATEELPLPSVPNAAPPVRGAPHLEHVTRPIPSAPVRYMTHRQFAATFHPLPGNYEVTLLHPRTHRPVTVRFTLPPGRIKEVDADPGEIRFDYGHWELEIHFKRDGRVTLDIDD
jgi:hypothetical protein